MTTDQRMKSHFPHSKLNLAKYLTTYSEWKHVQKEEKLVLERRKNQMHPHSDP